MGEFIDVNEKVFVCVEEVEVRYFGDGEGGELVVVEI